MPAALTLQRIQQPLHGISFFPAAVFMLFDGEGFILQRQRLFTRIRSGAVRRGKQRRRTLIYGLWRGGSVHWWRTLGSICFE
jgi:hypothetical protein